MLGDLRLAHRRGVYALAEKVKRGGDRIDFDALSDDGATGGWLQSRAWVERGVTFREQMDAARRAAGKP